jgi:hypothetical protein
VPALPWTSIAEPAPARTYVGLATKLPLTAHRHVPGFLRDAVRTFVVTGRELPLTWPASKDRRR